ncbi:MAG TPA: preprotein translocase subunit SecG [Rhizomicrobium sp.]|jgi:preprotein translocase subunit SecG|nr:preprotein translocase subunit SecG [Rhizomicrobium sp.]
MQTLLVFAELVIAVALIIFVLLQRSEGGALGMGGGGGGLGGLFSPRGAGDALTRTTAILAALFFLTCVGLNLLALHGRNEKSILDAPVTSQGPSTAPKPSAPANMPAPAGPQVPKPQ